MAVMRVARKCKQIKQDQKGKTDSNVVDNGSQFTQLELFKLVSTGEFGWGFFSESNSQTGDLTYKPHN